MKHYPKIKDQVKANEMPEVPEVVVSDISISRLVDDGLLVLYREMKQLKLLSAKGKLSAPDARDLRDHLKLLFELRDREDDTLGKLTEDELKAIVESQPSDNKPE